MAYVVWMVVSEKFPKTGMNQKGSSSWCVWSVFRYRSHYRKPLIFKKNLTLPSATWNTCTMQQVSPLQAIVSVFTLTSVLQPHVSVKMAGLKNAEWKEVRSAGQDTFISETWLPDWSIWSRIYFLTNCFLYLAIQYQQASCTQSNKLLKAKAWRYLGVWDSLGPRMCER